MDIPLSLPAVFTSGLTKRFEERVAVDDVNIRVEHGAFLGLNGSNGAGKTTLIKMLTTLLPPSAGGAFVAGFDVLRQPRQVRRRIGYVPQLISVDAALTGHENLAAFAKLYGIAKAERAARIDEAVVFMGLEDVIRTLVSTYSGGMIRRLEIALALLHRPQIVFLDEPTVGLDPVAKHSVWDRLKQLRDRFGTTVLLTTHEMDEVESLCDQLVIMNHGRLVAQGAPALLKAATGPNATMDDVYVKYTGSSIEQHGGYRETARSRRTTGRLG